MILKTFFLCYIDVFFADFVQEQPLEETLTCLMDFCQMVTFRQRLSLPLKILIGLFGAEFLKIYAKCR